MKKILFLFLAIMIGLTVAEAKTTKKKRSSGSSSGKPTLVIYCDLSEAPASGKLVEKVTFYPKSSKRVGVKYKGGQEKSYKVDWVDDQYGDAATYYLYNGGFVGYTESYLVLCIDTYEPVYYDIDYEKSNLEDFISDY